MTITIEEYNKLPVEDRLCYAARMSNASYDHCALMNEGFEEIERLKTQIRDLESELDSLYYDMSHMDSRS